MRSGQRGAMLLEALIAILIFSLGILALVGLQAASVNSVAQAKYRTDAAFLANQIIGEMWLVAPATIANFNYPGGTAPALAPWADTVAATLPKVAENPPRIVVAGSAAAGYTVTVTVSWQSPQALAASSHTEAAFIFKQ